MPNHICDAALGLKHIFYWEEILWNDRQTYESFATLTLCRQVCGAPFLNGSITKMFQGSLNLGLISWLQSRAIK